MAQQHLTQNNVQPTTSLFTLLLLFLSIFSSPSFCFKPKNLLSFNATSTNRHLSESGWNDASVTWYGGAQGDGSEGGACGYEDAVGKAPFSSMITAVGPSLFEAGRGCGVCYEVKCSSEKACSGTPSTVVVTDSCPGCTDQPFRFDLSGTALGSMAIRGQEAQLRNAGKFQIQYRRVKCNYPGQTITFKVDLGSNPNYFAALIEYEAGDGNLASVDLKQALDADTWIPMEQSWGAKWKLDMGSSLKAPFSIRLKSGQSGNVVVANNVIPADWTPGMTYRSFVNFNN